MANVIKDIPLTTAGDPEILPWATGGTTLEPTSGQESTGWQPQAIAGPPDYRLENYARLNQSKLNARGVQTGLFLECAAASIRLSGFAGGVNQRRITINGLNFDVTDAISLAAVRDAFVAAINANAPTAALVTAASAGNIGANYYLSITDNTPGNVYSASPSLAVSVLAGAGTITVSSPATTPIVREDANGLAADLVIGGLTADDDGDPAHDSRIVWRKAKGSFHAGTFTGSAADDASTGIASVALGYNVRASGAASVALGPSSGADGLNAVAIGGAIVAGDHGVGLGASSVTAGGTNGIAIGSGAASSAGDAVALGTNSTASAVNAFAAAGATASGVDTMAIGPSVVASTNGGAFASGKSRATLSATGQGARAHGYSNDGSTLSATGNGSMAIGYADKNANVVATAEGSSAQGLAYDTGTIAAIEKGAAAEGYANSSSLVGASGEGSFAHGFAKTNAVLQATGKGAVAFGHATQSNIQATGNGSTAIGYSVALAPAIVASGVNSQAIGAAVLASADYSQAIGYGAKATNRGEQVQGSMIFQSGGFLPQQGSSQKGSFHVGLLTTDATADQVMTPGAGAVTFTPLADTVYLCDANVIAKQESVDNSYAAFAFKFTLAYVAGVLTVKSIICTTGAATLASIAAGAAITHLDDGGAGGGGAWVLKVDTNAGAVRFKVTGAAATSIRWSARCDYVAVGQHA